MATTLRARKRCRMRGGRYGSMSSRGASSNDGPPLVPPIRPIRPQPDRSDRDEPGGNAGKILPIRPIRPAAWHSARSSMFGPPPAWRTRMLLSLAGQVSQPRSARGGSCAGSMAGAGGGRCIRGVAGAGPGPRCGTGRNGSDTGGTNSGRMMPGTEAPCAGSGPNLFPGSMISMPIQRRRAGSSASGRLSCLHRSPVCCPAYTPTP